jgi:hypothetical protein
MSGIKHDKGKPRISLVPREAIEGAARALGFGADKYGAHNFKGGLAYTRLLDATMRHILAYTSGEDNDPESGLNHIDHAIATLAMLEYMIYNKKEMDDREYKPDQGLEVSNDISK